MWFGRRATLSVFFPIANLPPPQCNSRTRLGQRRHSNRRLRMATDNQANGGVGHLYGIPESQEYTVNADTDPLLSPTPHPRDGDATATSQPTSKEDIVIYKRRWVIVLLFAAQSFTQSCIWNAWGPIQNSAIKALDWTTADIALLANWGPIMYIVATPLATWMMDTKGLRWSCLINFALVWVGAGLRCITLSHPAGNILIHTGHVLNALGGPVLMGGPPLVSATWFPVEHRTLATAFTTCLDNLGVAVSFILGPLLVPDYHQDNCQNSTGNFSETWTTTMVPNCTDNKLDIRNRIQELMYIEFAFTTLVMLAILVYFPAKPPSPPSITASIQRYSYKQGVKALICHRKFWIIGFAYAVSTGVFQCWQSVLDVNVASFGVTETQAGWLGFWSTVGGMFSGLAVAIFADIFTRRMKVFLLILYSGAAISFGVLAFTNQGWIPFSNVLLWSTVITGSLLISAAMPLFYELVCEATYPIAEGVTNGLLTCLNNASGLVFLAFLMIKPLGTMWMNWGMTGSIIICLPVLFVLNTQYKRLDIDTGVTSEEQAVSVNKTDDDDPLIS